MHIAICDDNIADRKHLERLLSRESDKRMGSPNLLYVDSYGDRDHFFSSHPLMYDLIFMDMAQTPTLTAEILDTLTQMGCRAPIVLYSSKVDYTQLSGLPDNVIHRHKPYISEPLPELLALGDEHVLGHIEKIAAHDASNNACYLVVRDIMYCSDSTVYFKDGTFTEITEDIGTFQHLCEPYPEFCRINKKAVANMRYVSMITPITIMMQDYREFRVSPFRYSDFKELKQTIDKLDS